MEKNKNREENFINIVSKYRDIGFGRMMQMISFAYHEQEPLGAITIGDCFGMLPPEDREVFLKTKKSDPIDYTRFGKPTEKSNGEAWNLVEKYRKEHNGELPPLDE